jgi:ssDNA-binding Zn-finger/Zn-ribbon topoisomerase 1
MGYEMFAPEVKAFHESKARRRIISAPARSSKSYSAAAEVVFRALPHKPLVGSLQWLIGTDYPTNKEWQYVWKWLVEERERWTMGGKTIQIEKSQNNPQNGNMLLVLDWGKGPHGRAKAIIEGKSSTQEKALQGEHVTQWVQSEAADHPERIWGKYGRTRSTWGLFPTTPKPGAAWLREMIERGEKDPSLSIDSFTYPRRSNPLYDEEMYFFEEKLAASRSPTGRAEDDPYFAEQFLGHWVYYTGMVLPFGAQNRVQMDDAWLDGCQLYVSCDYGYSDACVALFWALLPSGALLIFDEIYSRKLLTHEFVEQIAQKLEGREDQLKYATGDPKKPEVAEYMSRFGLNVIPIDKKAQAARDVGHRRLVDLMSVDPTTDHPMLFVAEDRCPKTVAEWKHLRYREKMTDEYGASALEGEDHAYDAARYFAMTRPAIAALAPDRDWLREAEREKRRERGVTYDGTRGMGRWNRHVASTIARAM